MNAGTVVLVTGATGSLGPSMVATLLREGLRVRALIRSRSSASKLAPAVEPFLGDLNDQSRLREAVKGVQWIFHLAAILHMNEPSLRLRKEFFRTNVEGSRVLARAARNAGVSKLLFFSSINLYGPSRTGEIFTEESPLRSTTCYSRTKAEAERIILSETPSVVLRLGAVYGPGVRGNYRMLVRALYRKLFIPVGAGRNRRTLVHVTDACEAALAAAMHPKTEGQVFNVTDGMVHTFAQIIGAMSRSLGRLPPSVHMPIGAARIAAMGLDAALRIVGRNGAPCVHALQKLLEDLAVSGEKLQRLGFRPRIGLDEGCLSCVRDVVGAAGPGTALLQV